MPIERVQLYPITVPRDTGITNQHVLVRVTDSDGVTGWGEMSDLSHLPIHQLDLPELEKSLTALLAS